jgi:hypothetical protein
MSELHGKTAVIALLAIAVWGGITLLSQQKEQVKEAVINIGVEHEQPATLILRRSVEGSVHIAEIGNESNEVMFVSVPSEWKRDEVRNVPLSQVTSDEPNFGYSRWHLPPNAIITFDVPYEWHHLVLHNPSKALLKARVTTVDLARERTDTNVYLVTDKKLELHF